MRHKTVEELEAGLSEIGGSPADAGVLRLIVRRPRAGEREVLRTGALDPAQGLAGDDWSTRRSSHTADGSPDPDRQVTVINSRVAALLAQQEDRWQLAGDQLFVDLDLSTANLPVGTRLALGSAVIEVTAPPHTGCHKLAARFGVDALKFLNSPAGRQLRLRGLHARVVRAGLTRVGDCVNKLKR